MNFTETENDKMNFITRLFMFYHKVDVTVSDSDVAMKCSNNRAIKTVIH